MDLRFLLEFTLQYTLLLPHVARVAWPRNFALEEVGLAPCACLGVSGAFAPRLGRVWNAIATWCNASSCRVLRFFDVCIHIATSLWAMRLSIHPFWRKERLVMGLRPSRHSLPPICAGHAQGIKADRLEEDFQDHNILVKMYDLISFLEAMAKTY